MSANVADAAASAARSAAKAAGVDVRDLDGKSELLDMIALFGEIWQSSTPLMNLEHLRALEHTGNFLAGAFDGDHMVGAGVGFLSAPPGAALHSHIAGVHRARHGRAIGFALKLHQRAWALRHGITEVTWTFDPLVRRNAFFNLVKLGALPREYLVDFYGEIDDAINAGQGSDRLFVAWNLTTATTQACCAGHRREPSDDLLSDPGVVVALGHADSGAPRLAPVADRDSAPVLLVQTPPDIEGLRKRDPGQAIRWRMAVREVLGGPLAQGAHVSAFTRDGHYVVSRTEGTT